MKYPNIPTGEKCPICDSGDVHAFFELSKMPAQDGVVYDSRQAAIDAPVGDIRLGVCRRCQYIGNLAYDPDQINFVEYSYSKRHSQQYRDHVEKIVKKLVNTYAVRNKTVIDVGCGEGYFLHELCNAGENRGVGIDPSLSVADEIAADSARLEFIKDFYSEKYAEHSGDLICCRHVIDELAEPVEFLRLILSSVDKNGDGLVYIELQNALNTFEKKLVWNIGYAKRSWFIPGSLQVLLQTCGLLVLETETLFGGDYLGIVGRRAMNSVEVPTSSEESLANLLTILEGFAQHFDDEIKRWQSRISDLRLRGEQMVIWGAGMRGVNFLHHFGDATIFPMIVDVNSDRQGSYLPGSGYRIESPEVLATLKPNRILISNPNYQSEISAQIEEMGLVCELETL